MSTTSTLNILNSILSYDDSGSNTNNNPKIRIPDVSFQAMGLQVKNAGGAHYTVAPNTSLTVFSGTRTSNISATTTFNITNTVGSTYRITNSGGPAPAFETPRSVGVDGTTALAVTINNNILVTMTYSAGTSPNFSSVQAGDILYIGPSTSFNVLNQGYFTILSTTSSSISFANPLAIAETQLINSNYAIDFQLYQNNNVQVGDTLVISAGFSSITQGTYVITNVTPVFIEFTSSSPLPLQTGVEPGATGLLIYSAATFFLMIRSDQSGLVQVNGASPGVPIAPFNSYVPGLFQQIGSAYSVVFQNLSLVNSANLIVFSAEHI